MVTSAKPDLLNTNFSTVGSIKLPHLITVGTSNRVY